MKSNAMNIRRLHDGCIDELMGLAFELLVQTKIVVFPPPASPRSFTNHRPSLPHLAVSLIAISPPINPDFFTGHDRDVICQIKTLLQSKLLAFELPHP